MVFLVFISVSRYVIPKSSCIISFALLCGRPIVFLIVFLSIMSASALSRAISAHGHASTAYRQVSRTQAFMMFILTLIGRCGNRFTIHAVVKLADLIFCLRLLMWLAHVLCFSYPRYVTSFAAAMSWPHIFIGALIARPITVYSVFSAFISSLFSAAHSSVRSIYF